MLAKRWHIAFTTDHDQSHFTHAAGPAYILFRVLGVLRTGNIQVLSSSQEKLVAVGARGPVGFQVGMKK